MPTDLVLLDHVLDLFSGLGPVAIGRMFSGTALYVRGDVMFATILGDTVWMKSDASTAAAYAAAGAHAFSFRRKSGLREVTSLMSLPEAAMDDPDAALAWARLSLPAAEAAAARKRPLKARKSARLA